MPRVSFSPSLIQPSQEALVCSALNVTSDRYAIPMARRLGRYPAKSWLQTSPYFAENLLLAPFFNQLNAARPYRLDRFPEVEQVFADAIKRSFYGLDPGRALQEAQKIGQPFLQRDLP